MEQSRRFETSIGFEFLEGLSKHLDVAVLEGLLKHLDVAVLDELFLNLGE